MVEFFSADIVFSVCRYRSCRADGDSLMMSAASFRARDAFCSPSAATTYKTKQYFGIMIKIHISILITLV